MGIIPTTPDACVHGTAWRISTEDAARYKTLWIEKMVPPYESAPIDIVTTKTRRRLAATVLHHANPLLTEPAREIGPTVGYIKHEYCEMVQRGYCFSYLTTVYNHVAKL